MHPLFHTPSDAMFLDRVSQRLAALKQAPFGTLLERVDATGGAHPALVPFTADRIDDAALIARLTLWRQDTIQAFQKVFATSTDGTRSWARGQLIDRPDRILFLVRTADGHLVGHIGLSSFEASSRRCTIDNLVRGEPGGHLGLMTEAVGRLIAWVGGELGVEETEVRVMHDNTRAVTLFQRCGFAPVDLEPLRKVVGAHWVEWVPAGPEEPVDRFYVVMRRGQPRADPLTVADRLVSLAADGNGEGALETMARQLGRSGLTTTDALTTARRLYGHGAPVAAAVLLRAVLTSPPRLRNATAHGLLDGLASEAATGFRRFALDLLVDAARGDRLNPDEPGRQHIIAQGLVALGQAHDAKAFLEKRLPGTPLDLPVVTGLASVEEALGNRAAVALWRGYARALRYPRFSSASPRERTPPRTSRPAVRRTANLLLVARHVNVRAVKIARFLRPLGWRVDVLCMTGEPADLVAFDAVHHYAGDVEAARLATAIGADVTHFLCTMVDYAPCALAIASGLAPVVADCYDIVNEMLSESYCRTSPYVDRQRPLERYVLENAHALCLRHLQIQVLKRRGIVRPRGPVLFFPEYCWNDVPIRRKLSADDDRLHIVYAGAVGEEYLRFCALAKRWDFHFHLYPLYLPGWNRPFEEMYRAYLEEADRNPQFHFHRPVYGPDFLPELSRYDVQLNVDMAALAQPEGAALDKIRLCYANKFADSLDANLLFVSNERSLCVWLGQRDGVAVGVGRERMGTPEFWRALRQRTQSPSFADDIERARHRWSMAGQIGRLDAFYRGIMLPG